MRHPLKKLAAAAFVFGLAVGFGQANAAPLPAMDSPTKQTSLVEKVGYYGYGYRRHGGYRHRGHYGGHYGYYRPYRHYRPHYGYGHRSYYGNYGYRHRYHHRRRH